MARFDVYPNPDGIGYLLDVQADLLNGLNTRIVVPMLSQAQAPEPARYLNPIFQIEGVDHVMVTQLMAAVPLSVLAETVGNLSDQADDITKALDMVFQGF
ncbi:CcdB family protein [Aestuariispira insulae]|uniref:Toxin CcdB n=1 Tax=Aestuariispira insulae TaxID=1461337 RepID=A0A3D9H6P4_9PROT|nr:CcdB family protein [Aestuariispira insulae]RED45132.1 toxin CcdB [Aestuariispira insulae]